MKTMLACMAVLAAAGAWAASGHRSEEPMPVARPTLKEASPLARSELGALVFADPSLSEPAGQACATCHDPQRAFTDPRGTSTSEGAVKGRFGPRNAPSIVYASLAPLLSPNGGEEGGYAGGQFWDGRADTLKDQVSGPLLNPLEMNNASAAMVLTKLKSATYASRFTAVYGAHALDDADTALGHLADAIAAYEGSIPKRFTSKYDAYLANDAKLTEAEARGLQLFDAEKTGPCTPNANGTTSPPCGCAQCHLDKPGKDGAPPTFTDFGYDNIGIPHNGSNPFYALPAALNPEGSNAVDQGLGAVVHDVHQMGQFKAPSLRNVAISGPYGHNGYFRTLKDVVHFYNTRDVPGTWFPPELKRGMNVGALGDLRLTERDENDLVAFMSTLTDGF